MSTELTEAEIESLDVMGMFPTPHGFAHATEWEEGVTRDLIRRVTPIIKAREAAARREALLEAAKVALIETAAEECFDEDGDPFDEGYALRFARDVLRILAEPERDEEGGR